MDSISFSAVPERPPMTVGDRVTVLTPDGVGAFVVTDVEPWEDEDGVVGQSVRFGPAVD